MKNEIFKRFKIYKNDGVEINIPTIDYKDHVIFLVYDIPKGGWYQTLGDMLDTFGNRVEDWNDEEIISTNELGSKLAQECIMCIFEGPKLGAWW